MNSTDLSAGYMNSFSYGNGSGGANLLGNLGVTTFTVTRVETYTFTSLSPAPEPTSALLCAVVLAAFGFWRHHRLTAALPARLGRIA